jgi:hypothetical protein
VAALMSSVGSLVEWQMLPSSFELLRPPPSTVRASFEQLVVVLTSLVGSLVEWQMLPSSVRALPSSSNHLRAPSELLRALSEHPSNSAMASAAPLETHLVLPQLL